jgi:4-hydroxy-2-oxoglutarate aldolase
MKLSGIMPPVTTPFKEGMVASEKLKSNLRKWNETDLSGFLVLGSNGEGVYLSERERLEVIEVCRDSIPADKTMLVGTGLESTQETVRFTNKAADEGADCALVITPFYFKGSMKPEIIHDHFVTIAESSRIGIVLYNVPKFTGINMEPGLVARLSRHPNILGIKDSSGDIGQLSQIIALSRDDFVAFTGSAPVLFPALCTGAAGGILAVANVIPRECVRIQTLFSEGRLEEARDLQNRMTPLARAVTAKYGIGGLKIAMDLAGYFGGDPRLPLQRPGGDAQVEIGKLLLDLGKG